MTPMDRHPGQRPRQGGGYGVFRRSTIRLSPIERPPIRFLHGLRSTSARRAGQRSDASDFSRRRWTMRSSSSKGATGRFCGSRAGLAIHYETPVTSILLWRAAGQVSGRDGRAAHSRRAPFWWTALCRCCRARRSLRARICRWETPAGRANVPAPGALRSMSCFPGGSSLSLMPSNRLVAFEADLRRGQSRHARQ